MRTTIAIPDTNGAAALLRTLESVARHTPEPHEIVLLGEEGEFPGAALPVRRLAFPHPVAAPAALNRLIPAVNTPYVLLLESGAQASEEWLGRLLAPLGDAGAGLSGPSTNLSWNEQQVSPRPVGFGWGAEAVAARARDVAERFGARTVALDTLHSLADFCYLFKRDLALALGGFDEAYGAGPCWEIDFSTRAARAGYAGVWVCGAYVHRAPPSRQQARVLQQRFEASKRLYQDRFCGLRLRGEKQEYEPHCRGEACEHFAPAHLIRVTLAREWAPAGGVAAPAPAAPAPAREWPPERAAIRAATPPADPVPLVSCIMPTRDRVDFALQAARYFLRQDYPNKELVILDDGAGDLEGRLAEAGLDEERGIRYVHCAAGLRLGAKRNRAVELARGDIIAQWDDDDWHAPARLSRQVAPLLRGEADITALDAGVICELGPWRFWRCSDAFHRKLFVEDVHGGTLVYRREVWQKLARYPDRTVAEDALFLRRAVSMGARLRRLRNDGLYMYVRHGRNAWAFAAGSYLDAAGWLPADEPTLPAEDRAFYAARSAAPPAAPAERPLVSCIMPTAGRRAFVVHALAYFARQDYAARELVVVDDGAEPVADLMPDDERVRHIRLRGRQNVGAKRNLACEAARGELIAHWDDDDWMAPDRLSRQVAALQQSKAGVCGMDRVPYLELRDGQCWEYVYPPSARPWLAGNTLCYGRAVWRRNPFPAIKVGEDNGFLWSGRAGQLERVGGPPIVVGLIHAGNTSPKRTSDSRWRPFPQAEMAALLGEDWSRYCDTGTIPHQELLVSHG
jgi:O-antigen biosynthesis protein